MIDGKRQTGIAGSQTLMRGLDVLEAVAAGEVVSTAIADRLGLTRSTTHRLAAALIERGYLSFAPREGYRLGAKLLELGHLAHAAANLVRVARRHPEALACASGDAVHLGVIDGDQALYLDKVAGSRRIQISSRVGERQPLTSTGLGRALMLDRSPAFWRARFAVEQRGRAFADWAERMADYAAAGRTYDLEENEDRIRCVAAPVREAGAATIAAISVSSAAQYMDDARMAALSADVIATATAISRELGWTEGKR